MSTKLIVNALVIALGLAVGAVVATLPDVPQWLTITGAAVAAVAVPLGARDALVTLFSLLPASWQQEIVLVTSVLLAAATTINAAVVKPPVALTVGVSVLVALVGGLGARSQVTPLLNPSDETGAALAPVLPRKTS